MIWTPFPESLWGRSMLARHVKHTAGGQAWGRGAGGCGSVGAPAVRRPIPAGPQFRAATEARRPGSHDHSPGPCYPPAPPPHVPPRPAPPHDWLQTLARRSCLPSHHGAFPSKPSYIVPRVCRNVRDTCTHTTPLQERVAGGLGGEKIGGGPFPWRNKKNSGPCFGSYAAGTY